MPIPCSKDFSIAIFSGFPTLIYAGLSGNANELEMATINGFDFLTVGEISDGDPLGPSIDVVFQTKPPDPNLGYSIAFSGEDTVGAGEDGTYRVTMNNFFVIPNTADPCYIQVLKNGVEQYLYDLNSVTGEEFVDIVMAETDILTVIFAADGINSISAAYHSTVVVTKLP